MNDTLEQQESEGCMHINFKHYGSWEAVKAAHPSAVYVGRATKELPQSPLANPYTIRQAGSRENAIELYRSWLWLRIRHKSPRILNALKQLDEDTVLVCWCHPLLCHAEVIERAWRYCKDERLL